jgi:putative phosphoribosyl transferase
MTMKFNRANVAVGSQGLDGILYVPPNPVGLIIFAHGSGSSRFSPRNIFVAERLVGCGFATLLFDLLSLEEAEDRRNVFDISLLGDRVREAVAWAAAAPELRGLPIGLFGASTGAAAALVAAADQPHIAAVVSRGGRPDLAQDALDQVVAPTLLIVGALDYDVLELNREAQRRLHCETRLDVIPGATHLFEEPGTMEKVVTSATGWFLRHLYKGEEDGARK